MKAKLQETIQVVKDNLTYGEYTSLNDYLGCLLDIEEDYILLTEYDFKPYIAIVRGQEMMVKMNKEDVIDHINYKIETYFEDTLDLTGNWEADVVSVLEYMNTLLNK